MEIKFFTDAHLLDGIPKPVKANKHLPSYFKAMPPQVTSHPSSGTVKRCVPFLEACSMGYIIPMWADMFVTAKDGDLNFDFPPNYIPQEERKGMKGATMSFHTTNQIKDHPLQNQKYGEHPCKLHSPWIIETSKGVSCLFTSPLNHMETRLKILDGVVDTDTYYNHINFPFLWTGGDGEFFIPQGTPLVQVIPFERTECKASYGQVDCERRDKVAGAVGTVMRNGYKTQIHHKGEKLRLVE
jgi:hypothetical protein